MSQHQAQIISSRRGILHENIIISQWVKKESIIGEVEEPLGSTEKIRKDKNANIIWNILTLSDAARQVVSRKCLVKVVIIVKWLSCSQY